MTRRLLTLVLLLTACTQGHEQAAPEGVYGVICMSDQFGDLSGLQVKAAPQGELTAFEVLLCDGWCYENTVFHGTAQVEDGRFTLQVEPVTANGQVMHPRIFKGQFAGENLTIEANTGDMGLEPTSLKPTAKSRCERGSFKGRQPLLEGWGKRAGLRPR